MKKANLAIGLIAIFFIATSTTLQAQDKNKKTYSDEDYDKAIAKGVEYLLSQQKDDGSWEEISRLERTFWRTGPTAMACYAILEAYPNLLNEKDNPIYPKVEKALRWMMTDLEQNAKGVPLKGDKQDDTTYSLGLRANAWLAAALQLKPKKASDDKDKKKIAAPDLKTLSTSEFSAELFAKCLEQDVIRLFVNGVAGTGGYGYKTTFVTPEMLQARLKDIDKVKGDSVKECDNSNSQYGLYGVWAGKRYGGQFEEIIPKQFYRICMEFWMKRQWKNGMWDYREAEQQDNDSQERSMTTAGVASMYVCFDEVFAQSFKGCTPPPEALAAMKSIQNGIKWLSDNFEENLSYGWNGPYYFYGVERVGLASGYKFFGKHDWYKSISYLMLAGQTDSGSWTWRGLPNETIKTSYVVLFLVRGRKPVLMTRLDYGGNTSGDWNNRPRALPNFCTYMNSAYETDAANWQIVTLESPPEAWHDAPILCITGSKPLSLTDEQIDKLRTYVNQGGTIFAVAECNSTGFSQSVKDMCAKMFPKYELTLCEGDHRLAIPKGGAQNDPKFSEVSNGVRPLVISTSSDLTVAWQTMAKTTMKPSFSRAADVVQYVTAMKFKNRGMGDWPEVTNLPDGSKTIKVARISFNGNSDPEPLAWQRFSRLMATRYQIKVDVTEPIALANLKDAKANLAVFYGTSKLELSAEDKTALKEFVAGGGKVLFDSAGGSAKFFDSAKAIIDELWGADSAMLLSATDPLYKLPNMEIEKVYYRKATAIRLGKVNAPQLLATKVSDKPSVMLSREDITAGLLGIPMFPCDGYESERENVDPATKKKTRIESAFEMMRNIVVSAGN